MNALACQNHEGTLEKTWYSSGAGREETQLSCRPERFGGNERDLVNFGADSFRVVERGTVWVRK